MVHKPTSFNELPEETKRFLTNLREDEIELLAEAVNFMRSVKTVGRFLKWVVILAVSTFIGAVSLGESIAKLRNYLVGSVK